MMVFIMVFMMLANGLTNDWLPSQPPQKGTSGMIPGIFSGPGCLYFGSAAWRAGPQLSEEKMFFFCSNTVRVVVLVEIYYDLTGKP